MQFQFDMSAAAFPHVPPAPAPAAGMEEVLRQLLEVQREQRDQLRAFLQGLDPAARWRGFLSRWHEEFPGLRRSCREALPILEKAYGKLVADLAEQIAQNGSDVDENEFAFGELLDRFGMRITQLGTLLSAVAPLAEAAPP